MHMAHCPYSQLMLDVLWKPLLSCSIRKSSSGFKCRGDGQKRAFLSAKLEAHRMRGPQLTDPAITFISSVALAGPACALQNGTSGLYQNPLGAYLVFGLKSTKILDVALPM
jgi:hypothetical protein